MREVAGPLEEAALARLEWTDPTPDNDWFADGAVKIVPTRDSAASVVVAQVLTMTFEMPGRKDIVVKHYDLSPSTREPEPLGERRFAGYR